MHLTTTLRTAFARTTGFLTAPVTTLLVFAYLAVALSTFITDQLAPVPPPSQLHSQYGNINVTEAFDDLHIITTRPHPYHSHANDLVREYLLHKLEDIRLQSGLGDQFIIDDDVTTSGTWAGGFGGSGSRSGNYFEGNNILVKIRGTANSTFNTPLPAVLFSAHFDCVSTASGATDNGMGVVTLLQLVRYFSTHLPHRTVLFNINNGEEDGLNGAHILLEHPWIKNTSHSEFTNLYGSSFLNVEGAGSGGRPLLFRATDLGVVRGWKQVDTPHANIISAEAFELGLIRSGTDYSVYTNRFAAPNPSDSTKFGPLRGLDFAFYRGRSKYHTKYDAISFTEGGDKALWAMLQPSLNAGIALANDHNGSTEVKEKAVFFELFNSVLVLFRLTNLLTFNITALIVGPISLILLTVSESALARSRAIKRQRATFSPSVVNPSELETDTAAPPVLSPGSTIVEEASSDYHEQHENDSGWVKAKRRLSLSSRILWKHGRFWIALVVAIGAQIASAAGFVHLNPFIVYRFPSIPILSSFTLSILVLALILSPPFLHNATPNLILSRAPITTNVPAWESFRTLLIHSYILSWLLVLLSTIGVTHYQMGGVLYAASACNGLTWLSAVICGVAGCFGVAETAELKVVQVSDPDSGAVEHEQEDETEVNERTPLVGRKHRIVKNKSKEGVDPVENPQPYVLWILVLLIYVPFPLILVSHMALFLIPSVNQTMIDGSPAVTVYAIISLLSLVAALPTIPFIGARRVHRYLFWFLGVVWIICTALAWVPWSGTWSGGVEGFEGGLFPFSEDAPLKVFFQQKVELAPPGKQGNDTTAKVVTTLTGATPFVHDLIVPSIPSYLHSLASGRPVGCSDNNIDERKTGLSKCSWETHHSTIGSFDASGMVPVATDTTHLTAGGAALKNRSAWDWVSTSNPWFEAHATSMTFNKGNPGARFSISANNNRACRLYFDHPVEMFRVRTVDDQQSLLQEDKDGHDDDDEASWRVQRGFESDYYEMLRLWTREWGKTFVVDLQWSNKSSLLARDNPDSVIAQQTLSANSKKLTGRVACEWVEYESGMVGMGLSTSPLPSPSGKRVSGGKIPALEEILTYLPKWAVVSKLTDGLVEVEERFEL
ncbi:hypothetical protein F5878DRAFT_726288 [Lentinula raphanica]|uniref:Peptide hydrolase n=1 Tax=Lentinula raphanica TaxID=153919 RepID=A0AA38P6L5_9AGAR|nr:hypothetical protein F5878DRAFT_726288 [Lentinula raphanica]